MPALHPAPRSPIQSPLISQPRPSPYLRGVNFRAATGSRLVDIPAHSSDKPLPLSCIFTRPCCRLIHQQEIYTCMLDTHCGSTFYAALLFTLFFFLFFFFFSESSLFSFTKRNATFRTAAFLSFFFSLSFPFLSSLSRINLIPTKFSNFSRFRNFVNSFARKFFFHPRRILSLEEEKLIWREIWKSSSDRFFFFFFFWKEH